MKIFIHVKPPGHDWKLVLGNLSLEIDPYYFAICPPGHNSREKIISLIKKVLGQWVLFIDKLNEGNSVVLPYSSFELHTDALRCSLINSNIEIETGHSSTHGRSFLLTDIRGFVNKTDFTASRDEQPKLRIRKEELVGKLKKFAEC